jgi:succinate-acetate transporter protein
MSLGDPSRERIHCRNHSRDLVDGTGCEESFELPCVTYVAGDFDITLSSGTLVDFLIVSCPHLFLCHFILTFILLLYTPRSTLAFFSLFFTLDLAFLMLSIGYLQHGDESPQEHCIIVGGAFGLIYALLGW